MNVGLLLIFQNYRGRDSDADMIRAQIHLAELAEPLGFDVLWPPEHHFTDYSACPDNVQFLSYVAAKTSRIRLGTGAVIVPWNDPLRVVEKVAFLDHLSNGRAVLGLGRGLARIEYDTFGIDMGTARARFDEAAPMIIDGLEKGFVEGNGPYYPQVRTEVRPRPLASFRDRFYAVGISPESVEAVARLGARLMVFSQTPWEMWAEGALAAYRDAWGRRQGGAAPAPLTGDLMFCHADAEQAQALGTRYMSNYYLSIIKHYELEKEHFKGTRGYEFYSDAAEAFRAVGLENSAKIYCGIQSCGTPEQILESLRRRREICGDYEFTLIAHYGGMPLDVAEQSLRLFAREVLPELKRW
jgi:alkanesulfonate monooxygenase SsuD/methylene tetrahydromethanopterin reductase-like flavin-dependent oxidoreductase (luciferase family)